MREIEEILRMAVTAPSGDNSQPWWFHVEDDILDVHLYPARDNRILNFELSGSYIAMGALIENIVIAASSKSLSSVISLFPDQKAPELVARISFASENVKADTLVAVMGERTTNRKPYEKKPIPADVLRELSSLGKQVRIIENRPKIDDIANASSIMERVALETEAIHKLFFESITWSEEEERAKGMGLPIKTTELPPPIQLLFRAIRHWRVTKVLNHVGLSFLAAKANAQTYRSSAAVGIILAERFDKYSYIDAGRIFQRTWLTATKYGLAFQPVTGLLFLAQRVNAGKTEVFDPKHIPMIRTAYKTVLDAFAVETGVPAMLFRIGYADAPSARTTRKAPEIR